MGLRARVDKQSCQSSGRCVAAAPGRFRLDVDHLGEALPPAFALPEALLLEIARACPALAISIVDDEGHEVEL